MPLPGLGAHPLLTTGSALLVVAAPLAGGSAHVVFLCPQAGPDPPLGTSGSLCWPARRSPRTNWWQRWWWPHRRTCAVLTCRELQILGLLIEGWTNARIAAALVIALRTGAAHMEHILAKLGARTRALAAVRALGPGLYVPPGLASIRA